MATRELPKLKVDSRSVLGTRESRRLRKSGRLPAVIYGHKQAPVHVTADAKEVRGILDKHAHVLEILLDGHQEPCLVKDVQYDHLGSTIAHLDLARVDLNERVTVNVELELTGEAVGLKEAGSILEQLMTSLEIQCLVLDIPESIKVDVSGLKKDESITVGKLTLPPGVATSVNPDAIVCAIHEVLERVEEPAVVEGAPAEPEVIGKKVEEGAEPAEEEKEKK